MSNEITVQKGMTLGQIAKQNGTTVRELAELNGIKDINFIKVGQKIKLPDNKGLEVQHPAMSDEEFMERMEANQRQIQQLQSRTLTQQAKQEIRQFIDAKRAQIAQLGEDVKKAAEEELKKAEQELQQAWQKGEDAYNKAKTKLNNKITQIKTQVSQGYNNAVDGAENAARSVAAKGREAAHRARDKAKVNVPQENTTQAPDFSKMTQEEILEYQNQQIQRLESETLSDRAKREVKENIDKAKRALAKAENSVVDAAYDGARKVYHGAKKAAKGVFNWLRG